MAEKKGQYDIPFHVNGNQLDYPFWDEKQMTWKPNHVFQDTLTLVTYGRGRSSVTFEMKRKNGKTVSVFVSDFCDMIRAMNRGVVAGAFTFTKKGANYGCKMVKE